jgi:hypothetical protein
VRWGGRAVGGGLGWRVLYRISPDKCILGYIRTKEEKDARFAVYDTDLVKKLLKQLYTIMLLKDYHVTSSLNINISKLSCS